MLASVIEKNAMLYCPKCQTKYEEGTQRFCVKDKTRLIAAPSAANAAKKANGVFSSILSSTLDFENEAATHEAKPRDFEQQKAQIQQRTQQPPQPEKSLTHSSSVRKEQSSRSAEEKNTPRFIKPSEIPSGTAEIGDRQNNPVGRLAVTAENPNVLLGHTIKGRYSVVGRLRQDENSILFLAKDKLSGDKKAFVRVLLGEDDEDDYTNKIYAEERVSLSHINHPNILRVIDSGELPEGKPFVVTNYVEGKTLADLLLKREQFNAMRTARIINQAASALSEAHQNDILHRRLTPEDIILIVSEEGAEQVKLTNFGIFEEEIPEQNLAYTAPEQIEGHPAKISSDTYSLAVIAYQMLTGRLPHTVDSAREMLNAQREGLKLVPSNVRFDVKPSVDEILEKALSSDASRRYPKARDFGDAFFNAIATGAPPQATKKETKKSSTMFAEDFELDEIETDYFKKPEVKEPEIPEFKIIEEIEEPEFIEEEKAASEISAPIPEPISSFVLDKSAEADFIENPEEDTDGDQKIFSPILMPTDRLEKPNSRDFVGDEPSEIEKFEAPAESGEEIISDEIAGETPVEEPAWKRRSIEGKVENNWKTATLSLFGLLILIAAVAGIFYYFANRPPEPVVAVNPSSDEPVQTIVPTQAANNIEIPPLPRSIEAPPNSVYFQNSTDNLSKDLQKSFRGFQLYYPKTWKRNNSDNKFIDISRETANGLPIEQFMVSPYESDGTFQKDEAKFADLVEKSNADLKKFLPNYEVVGQGETNINGGWKTYEVKFKNVGEVGGKPFTLWGRRLWVPAARPGAKSGLVVTMFATSLSETVKSVEDVGIKGDLYVILDTFEPDQNM